VINIKSRKYYSQWGNGMTFTDNLSGIGVDLAEHLKGSAGEKLKVVTRVKAALISRSTLQNPYEVVNGNYLQRNDNGSFIDEGFAIGQECVFIVDYDGVQSGNAASVEFVSDILQVSDSQIQFDTPSVGSFILGQKTDHALACTGKMGALVYRFGLIENSATDNFKSPYTDDTQEYYFGTIDTTTPTEHTMIAAGGTSGSRTWKSGDATVQYISSTNDKGLTSPTYDYIHEYEVTQIFVINPVFIENYLAALDNGSQPEEYIGANSPKHITEYEFRYTLTNPNTTVRISDTGMLGSVGWFGENYNGFNDIYSVVVTDYRDTLTNSVVDGLQLKRKTKVSGVITGSGFANTSKGGAYFFWAAPIGVYSSIQSSFQNTFLHDDKIITMIAGTASTTGTDRIKRFKLDYVSATTLTFEIDIELSNAEAAIINPTLLDTVSDKYFIGIQVGNTSTVDTSNKVILQVDWAEFVINNDVENLATFKDQMFFDHSMDISGGGHTDYKGWLQDGFSFTSTVVLNKVLNANLKALQVRIVAQNQVTGNEFDLQSYTFNLADVLSVNSTPSYQQLSQAVTLGFKLHTDDPFNQVLLEFDSVSGGLQNVNFTLGMKFDWQSWVLLDGADTIFYDNSLNSKGRGLDASRYSMNLNYQIRLVVDADVMQLTDVATRYSDYSPFLQIYGWGLDGDTPANWSQLIQTFDENDNNLSGAILRNADTLFKITWTPQSGDTTGFNNQWAVHRIEQVLVNGYNSIHELSSLRDYPANNILKPVSGELFLKITDNGTGIITECLIDYTKLSGASYNISGRLGRDITYPRYSIARDIKFLLEDQSEMILLNMPDNGTALTNSLRHTVLDANGFVSTETAIPLDVEDYFAPRLAVDYAHETNGKPNFYMVTYTGTATELYEFLFDGTVYQQSKVFSEIIGGSGPTCIRIDPECAPNNKPLIWFGNLTSNYNSETGFIGTYHDGAVWQNSNIITYDSGTPLAKHLQYPLDVLFHEGKVYLMNVDDNSNPTDDWERGKISVWEQTVGDPTDPVDRMDFLTNYTLLHNLYLHTTASVGTDGIGTVGDMAYAVGMEILETDANNNPVILCPFDASAIAGARHFARIYSNDATPTGPADWTIQTPMAFTNFKFGNPQALRGKAGATSQTSNLQVKNQCHIAVIDGNTWITGHKTVPYWVKHIISDWSGVDLNDWYVYTPNDPEFLFTTGNTLHE
jgi:hypothetical protein